MPAHLQYSTHKVYVVARLALFHMRLRLACIASTLLGTVAWAPAPRRRGGAPRRAAADDEPARADGADDVSDAALDAIIAQGRRDRADAAGRAAAAPAAPAGPSLVAEEKTLFDAVTGPNATDVEPMAPGRLDIAVRALRGDFSPAPDGSGKPDVEGTTALLDSLAAFPSKYRYACTARLHAADAGGGGGAPRAEDAEVLLAGAFSVWVQGCVADVTGAPVEPGDVDVRTRGGKFISVRLRAWTESSEMVREVYRRLREDERVLFTY